MVSRVYWFSIPSLYVLASTDTLSAAEQVEFLFLLNVTGLTKGNLSAQSQKLESAGYVKTIKAFRGRVPVTSFKITSVGRRALLAYHEQLRSLLPPIEIVKSR